MPARRSSSPAAPARTSGVVALGVDLEEHAVVRAQVRPGDLVETAERHRLLAHHGGARRDLAQQRALGQDRAHVGLGRDLELDLALARAKRHGWRHLPGWVGSGPPLERTVRVGLRLERDDPPRIAPFPQHAAVLAHVRPDVQDAGDPEVLEYGDELGVRRFRLPARRQVVAEPARQTLQAASCRFGNGEHLDRPRDPGQNVGPERAIVSAPAHAGEGVGDQKVEPERATQPLQARR